MARWVLVTEGEGAPPRVIEQGLESDLVYARPPGLVAWGTADGVPWRIQSAVTAPGPDADWWDHGPVGSELAFRLGRDDAFGGGDVHTRLQDRSHLSASICFFGSHPKIVSWVGVVTDAVAHIEVRLDDGEVRTVEVHEGPEGFPNLFWFFPPRGATGTVVSIAADGSELQTDRLIDTDVPPNANSGTSINGLGYSLDRPPPGWPDDPTEYGPGEGPRHAEEFHLHEATFPLYAVPPHQWTGHVSLSGSGSSGRQLTEVCFGYFDEPGGSRRGFEIVNAHPDRRPSARPIRRDDIGIWANDRTPDDDVENFASRFVTNDERSRLRREYGSLEVGPTRIVLIGELEVAGVGVEHHRREYRPLPSLRTIGFALPGTRLTLLGWDLTFEEMEGHARALERLELGTELFAMKAAQTRSDQRFDELHGHRHGGND
jgi:hypothetical protein